MSHKPAGQCLLLSALCIPACLWDKKVCLFLANAWSSFQLAAPNMCHFSIQGQEELQGGVERDLRGRNSYWTQEAPFLVLCYRKNPLAWEMYGWSCKPFLCWKQHLVASPTHPSSCPWCLAVWGHEGAATAGESSPLWAASAGSFPSKGSLCLYLLGVLGISLCGLSKHEHVVRFYQDKWSCSGLC